MSGVKASWVGVRQAAGPGVVLRLYGHPVSVLACPEEGEDNSDCLDFSPEDNYRESSGLSGLSTALCMRMEEDPTLPFCLVSVAIMTVIGESARLCNFIIWLFLNPCIIALYIIIYLLFIHLCFINVSCFLYNSRCVSVLVTVLL